MNASHPAKTLYGENVVFFRKDDPTPHPASPFCVSEDSPHEAKLAFYCPKTNKVYLTETVRFGKADDRDYYVNPDQV